jgi:hypothetical protein
VISHTTLAFRASLAKLPASVRQQARESYRVFVQDPYHPGLNFEHIGDSVYSVRVGLHYRALGLLQGNTIYWNWIGIHTEYDQKKKSFQGKKKRKLL